ncbi:ACT domain-containing protein [Methanosarcina sp. T3]|uniref:ACT domain-containing protein n=1 Tax=Methanosarcina sp. T3 TaxID=3439062 RepID=UPI003F849B2A
MKPAPGMKQNKLTLSVLKSIFGICRLDSESEIPAWAYEGGFFSITRTPEELSLVCPESSIPANIPEKVRTERGWRCLKVEGPLDFGLTGILAGISRVLANNSISIFAVSTYDTDYILLREINLKRAIRALEEVGYEIRKDIQNETRKES